MQKIDASRLLIKILNDALPECTVVLSDELIFQKCVEDVLLQKTQKRPKIFEGVQALAQYNQYVRQNDLFEPILDSLILLDESFTTKKTDEQKKITLSGKVFIFGKTILRHQIGEKTFPGADVYLCYTPNVSECQKCAEILVQKYADFSEDQSNSNENSRHESASMAERALVQYNNNLYHCALHFERMKKGCLSFEDAKLSDVPLSGFDIVQTLLEKNLDLLDMRLSQHASNADDASHIFRAMVYFFKQLAGVHAELAKGAALGQALLKAKIPYPAQENIKKAIQVIPYSKIEHFFSVCAQIELDLRERKNTYQILFQEMSKLI